VNLESFGQQLKLPDLWQHTAVNHLRAGRDVIVSAPTGAGKTFVFELLAQQGNFKRQLVYTVPTRALANDKYAEWKDAGWNVGLATGDLSMNVRAPVLVATLETQMERLIRNDGPAVLVMDEFQMISDAARGAHYEGAIVLAPPDTQLLLLSGSVANSEDVAAWMRRLGRSVEVVATRERPVPLDEVPLETLSSRSKGVEGWWPRLVMTALQNDLAPLLIFAPRRRDAESIAQKLATHLPPGEPLGLTQEQRSLAGREFAAMLEKRIAYHHSGLGYALRAGLVEPLAKAGQLRVIVSTMGLAAGINFSVRSVHVSSTSYHDGLTEQQLTADDLLQMFGRAGRRGLDERGYVITTRESPVLADASPARLQRSSKLSWPLFLRVMRRAALDGRDPFAAASEFASRMFARTPPELGLEESGGFPIAGEAAHALFGLKATRKELLNSQGRWEEMHTNPKKQVALEEAWLAMVKDRVAKDETGPALESQAALESVAIPVLANARFVQSLPGGLGRICKLAVRDGVQMYGKEIAIGQRIAAPLPGGTGGPDSIPGMQDGMTELFSPTKNMRKLLKIPPHVESLTREKIDKVAIPKLLPHFPGASLHGLVEREGLLWAQFDFGLLTMEAVRDSLGRWLVQPQTRLLVREETTDFVQASGGPLQHARPGTPVHSWRSLGLIESDGSPTRRGVIFSFFQHGEGLAIAAALEVENYPIEELVLHFANLRSDCRVDLAESGSSERLAAVCRAAYGFVNHHGYMEAGLPLGYGEGTAELLGLIAGLAPETTTRGITQDVAEGDLTRAFIEWLSLLRHITRAPDFDWPRWTKLKEAAAQVLEQHLAASRDSLHPKLPPLTAKQKHDRPRLWVRG
jgi:superfamily II DNA/RNA helicase